MPYKREDLRAQLKRGELSSVYVLFGAETYLRDLAAKTIADRAFNEGDARDFNETSFALAKAGELAGVLTAAYQMPMMASRRLVRVTNVRITQSGRGDTIKEEEDENALRSYLDDPAKDSIVIFVADELNGVRRMGKLLREKAFAVDFEPMADAELTNWAADRISETGCEIERPALDLLVKRAGPDVRRVTNEASKLVTAALPDKLITAELVDELVPFTRELDNFEFGRHLVAGDRPAALRVLRKIIDDGAEPLMILGLIAYNVRRLLIAKEMMEHSADRRDVANVLKLRYSDQESFLAAARRADADRLRKAVIRIAETDVALKTSIGGGGDAGGRMLLEMLVCELA
ncbi:MAG: DNA polymerase III subunit delta [Acidobacteriota bacterium]|nr:MAG: DNA polymerase III subunit delta [Acidobacteriota bacterium]